MGRNEADPAGNRGVVIGFLLSACLVLNGCGSGGSSSAGVTSAAVPTRLQPCGVFSADAVLNLPYVHGKVIHVFWSAIQPDPMTFDWTPIDTELFAVQGFGQKATLVVLPVPNPPGWIFDMGAVPYVDEKGDTLPLPWDSVYLAAWWSFIDALGARYGAHPDIVMVYGTGPSTAVWLAGSIDGYSPDLFIDAWQRTIDRWVVAFPDRFIALLIRYFDDGSGPTVTQAVIRDYAITRYNTTWTRIGVIGDMLTGATPDGVLGSFFSETAAKASWTAFQACGSFTNPTGWPQCTFLDGDTPELGFQHGTAMGATYFEFYQSDLQNADYMATFRTRHDSLCAQG